jgi:hypothetical protein
VSFAVKLNIPTIRLASNPSAVQATDVQLRTVAAPGTETSMVTPPIPPDQLQPIIAGSASRGVSGNVQHACNPDIHIGTIVQIGLDPPVKT